MQALVSADMALLESVMATPAELTDAGVPKDVVKRIAAEANKRGEQLAALKKLLVGWNAQTIWNRFDGTFPHVIPADPTVGLAKDMTLYENAMVIPGTTAAEQNAAKLAFLQVPDLIQLGATWKFIGLPHAIDPEKPIVAAIHGASNRLIDVEALSEAELMKLHRFYHRLSEMAKRDNDLGQSHTVDEAEALHRRKSQRTQAEPGDGT